MKTETIKKNFEYRKVYKRGRSTVGRYLVVYFFKNNKNYNRLGITVSKKVGNSVIRNRVRRLTKESFRKLEDDLNQGYDIVVVARVISNKASYHQIEDNLYKLLDKLIKS